MSDSNPNDLPSDIAAMLRTERAVPPPSPDVQAAVMARIGETVGLVSAAPLAPIESIAAPSASTYGWLGAGGKWIVALALVTAAGTAVVAIRLREPTHSLGSVRLARTQPSRSPAVVQPIAPNEAASSRNNLAPTPPVGNTGALAEASANPLIQSHGPERISPLNADTTTHAAHTSRANEGPEEIDVEQIGDEQLMLTPAHVALQQRDPVRAAAALQAYEHRYPRGHLSEERDALQIELSALQGNREVANERADQFRRRYPHSILLDAIENALAESP